VRAAVKRAGGPRLARYGRFGRFVLIGLSNTAVSYATFLGLFAVFPEEGWRTEASQTVAYLAGMAWSFFWNRRWVFSSTNRALADAVRFAVVQLVLLGLSVVLVSVFVDELALGPVLGWVVAMGIVTVTNYGLLRSVVFGQRT
jgi:putative flippase GtrA